MEIVEKIKTRELTDYEFMFASGAKLAVTLDPEAGDTIKEEADRYVIHIAPKPTMVVGEMTEEEDLEVFKAHLAAKSACKYQQRMPTEEEMFDMQQTIKQLSKAIN